MLWGFRVCQCSILLATLYEALVPAGADGGVIHRLNAVFVVHIRDKSQMKLANLSMVSMFAGPKATVAWWPSGTLLPPLFFEFQVPPFHATNPQPGCPYYDLASGLPSLHLPLLVFKMILLVNMIRGVWTLDPEP